MASGICNLFEPIKFITASFLSILVVVVSRDDKIQISGKATINRLDFNMKESNDIDNEVLVMFKVEFDK